MPALPTAARAAAPLAAVRAAADFCRTLRILVEAFLPAALLLTGFALVLAPLVPGAPFTGPLPLVLADSFIRFQLAASARLGPLRPVAGLDRLWVTRRDPVAGSCFQVVILRPLEAGLPEALVRTVLACLFELVSLALLAFWRCFRASTVGVRPAPRPLEVVFLAALAALERPRAPRLELEVRLDAELLFWLRSRRR